MIAADSLTAREAASEPSRLPESLGAEAALLGVLDGVCAACVVGAAYALGDARSALLTMVVAAIASYGSGRYVSTYAAVPRDEWYATLVPSIIAAVALAVLVPIFSASWLVAYASLALWTLLAGSVATRLTARRRRSGAPYCGTSSRLDPASRARAFDPWRETVIRAIDVTLAGFALLALSPLWAAIAMRIIAESGSPALFRQERFGARNRPFEILKFRTMKHDAGTAWASSDDERITHTGAFLRRTSLDEAPQLLNVLRGEMSLIGPRPEMIEYADFFAAASAVYHERHLVRPGISGWAQLHYDRNYPPDRALDVLRYDLFWIRHRSISLYIYCILKTSFEVLGHKAI